MESCKPKILLLSAYDAGSHKQWRSQLALALPDYHWSALTLPPRHFRWRIRGNPLSWLDAPEIKQNWDLLIATSMVDLACLKGLNPELAKVPTILYMHENQFAYPQSARQHSSNEPATVNLYAALSADKILFNSAWNKRSFLREVEVFLNKMPDQVPSGITRSINEKSHVLPVPLEDSFFCPPRSLDLQHPHILWNHRWEYDKGPQGLLLFLRQLKASGRAFSLSVVGEQFRRQPGEFKQIHSEFKQQLVHFGYLQHPGDYRQLLQQADIVLSTALHDFQGLAMLEAMASGCMPLAPRRLAYPEYVPDGGLYASTPEDPATEAKAAVDTLDKISQSPPSACSPDNYRISFLAEHYARHIDELLGLSPRKSATYSSDYLSDKDNT